MERILMTKYGFKRWKEEDFSDDGNRFTCYKVGKRVRVSKLVSEGEAYIDAGIDYGNLPYEVYSKLPCYKELSALNGVSTSSITEEDLQKLYEDCLTFEKAYDEAYDNMNWPTKQEIADKAREFFNDYIVVYNQLEQEFQFNILTIANKCTQYDWTRLRDYLISFRREFECYADPDKVANRDFMQVRSIGFVKTKPNAKNSFWVKCIRDIIEKYSD